MSRAAVLRVIGAIGERGVLIGGQAISWWAEHYLARGRLTVAAGSLYTSKDVDLLARDADARLLARDVAIVVGGVVNGSFKPRWNSLLAARVEFVDGAAKREVDVLRRMNGLLASDVFANAVRFDATGESAPVFVIHPVLLLEQRLHLMAEVEGYQTEHAVAQARLAIAVARERLLDELEDGWSAARKMMGRALEVATAERAHRLAERHAIEPLDALPDAHPNFPQAYLTEQRPRMLARRRR